MDQKYNGEEVAYFLHVFKKYEKKFGVNLYCAWDFSSVDWIGLANAAEQSIKNNSPLTDEQKSKYYEQFTEGMIY